MDSEITIIHYDDSVHRQQTIDLWLDVFHYPADYNQPDVAIDQKIAFDDLFFVAVADEVVIGTVMVGYDGHRGWIYSMAVQPDLRHGGVGSMLLAVAEESLRRLGCRKVNLQIYAENAGVCKFYEANGFSVEDMVSMGKRLD